MADVLTIRQLKFRTFEQGGETKCGVEFYTTSDPPELKVSQDLTEAEAQQLRDFLDAEYPAT